MFLLDTDHIGVIQRQAEPQFGLLVARIARHSPTDFHVSIISFHEEVAGWNAYLSRARTSDAVVRAYRMFRQILADFAAASVLPYDDAAAAAFESLRTQRVRIATMDLRIAAIALARNMTVLTRNLADFRKVPGLKVEDWTVS